MDSTAAHPERTVAPPVPGQVVVTHTSGQAYGISVRGHDLTVDQPVAVGGGDSGPTPVPPAPPPAVRRPARRGGLHDGRRSADPSRVGTAVRPALELNGARLEALRAVVDHCTVHTTLRRLPEVSVDIG
ncbi:hypothetical protein [Streptomyces sp. NPDC005209]|uniref:hypothetical protein n=1 Tax=Streptomyces sp. NPDC005209 TaxID=3156715 RepID=UPI0033A50953